SGSSASSTRTRTRRCGCGAVRLLYNGLEGPDGCDERAPRGGNLRRARGRCQGVERSVEPRLGPVRQWIVPVLVPHLTDEGREHGEVTGVLDPRAEAFEGAEPR